RKHGGTGLGLAICRRILNLMHGNIRVESAPGQGSRFFVELRLPKARRAAQPLRASSALEGVRVLVVGDNRTIRDVLQQQLQSWAMRATCVAARADALR